MNKEIRSKFIRVNTGDCKDGCDHKTDDGCGYSGSLCPHETTELMAIIDENLR